MRFLRSLADFLLALTFLCCCCIFDSYVTYLTLSFNTICLLPFILIFGAYIVLNSPYFGHIQISQSRSSLEPKSFLRGLCPLNPPLRGSDPPVPLTLTTIAFLLIFDIHPGHLFSRESNIYGIPQSQQGCNNF